MAIWQFKVFLIPERRVREAFDPVPVTIPIDMAQDYPWWSEDQPEGLEREVSNLIPEIPSWSEGMRIWGDERGDAAAICYDGEDRKIVIAVELRVDVGHLSVPFVAGTCALAKKFRCFLLVWKAGQLLRPQNDIVLAAISRSEAKKYVDNPADTLSRLPEGDADIRSLWKEK